MPDEPRLPTLREDWIDRLGRYEMGLLGLIKDIRTYLPQVSREDARAAMARVELAAGAVEDLIHSKVDGDQSRAMKSIRGVSEQLLFLKADLERKYRDLDRDEGSIEIEERRTAIRELREEIERGLGDMPGHGAGEGE